MNKLIKYVTPTRPVDLFDRFLMGNTWFQPYNSLWDFNDWEISPYKSSRELTETDKEYKLELSLAGFKKEEIEINILNNFLTVSAENKDKNRIFNYSTNFLETVDENKIKAKLENGLLTILLPKTPREVNRGKTIKVV